MTTHALLHIADELERLARDPSGIIFHDDVLRLAKFARGEAGQEVGAIPAPEAERPLSIRRLCIGDVLARRWSDETTPPVDPLFKVVKTHRKQRKVSVVTPDGRQLTLPLCEFTHRWPRDAAHHLHIAWRFDPATDQG